ARSRRRARAAPRTRRACRRRGGRRDRRARRTRTRAARSSAVLQLVPARSRQQLEQRTTAVRVVVLEVGVALVERDLELPLLHALVEPGAAEDELLQPVDQRLALDEGDLGPMANEVAAELAAGLLDRVPLGELDQVGRLVAVELVPLQQAELDGGCRDAL